MALPEWKNKRQRLQWPCTHPAVEHDVGAVADEDDSNEANGKDDSNCAFKDDSMNGAEDDDEVDGAINVDIGVVVGVGVAAPVIRSRPFTLPTRRDSASLAGIPLVVRLGSDGDRLSAVIEGVLGVDAQNADVERAANALDSEPDDDDAPAAGAPEAIPNVAPAVGVIDGDAGAVQRPTRVDVQDTFVLIGDIPKAAELAVEVHYFAFIINSWALRFLVPQVAVTALLLLLRGLLGCYLNLPISFFVRGGPIPATARTLYGPRHAGAVASAMNISILRPIVLSLPDDENLRGRGHQRSLTVYASPDLRVNCALPLLDSSINNSATPMHYLPQPVLPAGFVCAGSYYSPVECARRQERLERATRELPADIAAFPGMLVNQVGIVAVGVNIFLDSAQLHKNQTAAVNGFLLTPTNLHGDVTEQAASVAIGGMWLPVTVNQARKVAGEDVSMRASQATHDRRAMVDNDVYMAVVADPVRKMITGPALVVRASSLKGLPPEYPYQYVALVYYFAHVNVDGPMVNKLCGHNENQCPFDSVKTADLSMIPGGNGKVFKLPLQHTTDEVAQHYYDLLCTLNTVKQSVAEAWLLSKGFHVRVAPPLLFSWWAHKVPGANDMLQNIIYDGLHCYFIGLLAYFEDAVILAIYNSWSDTEKGNAAVALFESRLASFPCFDTGYRLYRAYPGGFSSRSICSGNDRFFLLLMFIAAIGLGEDVIGNSAIRRVVLSALEAASVLAFLLRATALTAQRRLDTYAAARNFVNHLMHETFKGRQTSEWSIFKFHMLFHIVNNLSRGAAGCVNSSKFEAALRIYLSRIASRSSSNHNILADIARHYSNHVMSVLLRAKGGKAADAIAGASAVPKSRNKATLNHEASFRGVPLTAGSLPAAPAASAAGGAAPAASAAGGAAPAASAAGGPGGGAAGPAAPRTVPRSRPIRVGDAMVAPFKPAKPRLGSVELEAVSKDLQVCGACFASGVKTGSVASMLERVRWFSSARVYRPDDRFVALVHTGFTVELNSRNPAKPDSPALREDPTSTRLGRVVAFFYVDPPRDGSDDGLPVAPRLQPHAAPVALLSTRMFVVVWPFLGQREEDAAKLRATGLTSHTIRAPFPLEGPPVPVFVGLPTQATRLAAAAAAALLRPPLKAFPLAAVLRAVRPFPSKWPSLPLLQVHKWGGNQKDATCAHRKNIAAAKEGSVLIFWAPERGTFLPPSDGCGGPVGAADGANEDSDEEAASGEDSDDADAE